MALLSTLQQARRIAGGSMKDIRLIGMRHANRRDPDRGSGARTCAAVRARARALTDGGPGPGVRRRVLALHDDEVGRPWRDVVAASRPPARSAGVALTAHYEQIAHRIPKAAELSDERRSSRCLVHP